MSKQKIAFRDRSVPNAKRMGFSIRIGETVVEFNQGEAMVDSETAQYVRKNMEGHFVLLTEDGSPDLPPVEKQAAPPVEKKPVVVPDPIPDEPVSDDDSDDIAVGEMVEDPEEAAPKTRVRVSKPRPVKVKQTKAKAKAAKPKAKPRKKKGK